MYFQERDKYLFNSDLTCSNPIQTGNNAEVFQHLILNYKVDEANSKWRNSYGPYCLSNNTCAEFVDVPMDVECSTKPPSKNYRRLCYCQAKGSYKNFLSIVNIYINVFTTNLISLDKDKKLIL